MGLIQKLHRFSKVFGGIRLRILVGYLILIAMTASLSSLIVWQTISFRMRQQAKSNLTKEIEEFRRSLQVYQSHAKPSLQAVPVTRSAILKVFNNILFTDIPDNGEFLITFLDGSLYKSSPTALPEVLRYNHRLLNQWGRQTKNSQGSLTTAEGERIVYAVESVPLQDGSYAVYVVVDALLPKQQLIQEIVTIILQVDMLILGVMAVVTWIWTGQTLAPLRLLLRTIRSISGSDMTTRIPVHGTGEVAELTQTFNEMVDRLQTAFNSQREFIQDAGHELRTPLTIIRCHLEDWQDCPPIFQPSHCLVLGEVYRMERIVNDLLLLAKAERPDFLITELVTVSSLMTELFEKAQTLADRHWQLCAKAEILLVADRQRLTQAMINLIQNAIQHTNSTDTIALGAVVSQGQVRLSVVDTGVGIAAVHQKRIFERFTRIHHHRTAGDQRGVTEGAGLGLAIVQAIAEAHGGRVELQSELGQGATFTLVLPLDPLTEVQKCIGELTHAPHFNC